MSCNYKGQSGYSLIELLVVITIMVLLTGVGASIYSQTRHIETVSNLASDIEGYLMEAQSLASGPDQSDVLGYRLSFNNNQKIISLDRLIYIGSKVDINDIKKGTIDPRDYRVDNIKEIELANQVSFSQLGVYNNQEKIYSLNNLIFPVGRGSRVTFNGGVEPDFNQTSNLFSPFNLSPDRSGSNQAVIGLRYTNGEKTYHKSVKIYLKTGEVEVGND